MLPSILTIVRHNNINTTMFSDLKARGLFNSQQHNGALVTDVSPGGQAGQGTGG